MTAQPRTAALVVGAGPVGLAAACQLLQRGVGVRVVDAADEPPHGSRAVQLWPLALDALRDVGVLAEARAAGRQVEAMVYHLAGGRDLSIRLGERNEPLLLPQEQTNRLLEQQFERLGGKVEWGTRVVDVTQSADAVTVRAENSHGAEDIHSDWLIAADGVRSTVRERLGIDFAGARVQMTFMIAEGKVDGDFDRSAVHYFLGAKGSFVFAPLPGDRVRIAAAVTPTTPHTDAAVQQLLDERGPGGLRLSRLDAITEFTSAERIAAELRRGRCFLVGDAAHTHSPIGGQGLNLGLQDAFNLSWKLAAVIEGTLPDRVLDTYQAERTRAAEQVVSTTHQLIKVFTLTGRAARLRNASWGLLGATGVIERWFAPLMAGWRVRYPVPGTVHTAAHWPLPAPGTFAPGWVPPAEPGAGYRLVTVGARGNALQRHGSAVAGQIPHLHVWRPYRGYLLIRPDGHVAAAGRSRAGLLHAIRTLGGLR